MRLTPARLALAASLTVTGVGIVAPVATATAATAATACPTGQSTAGPLGGTLCVTGPSEPVNVWDVVRFEFTLSDIAPGTPAGSSFPVTLPAALDAPVGMSYDLYAPDGATVVARMTTGPGGVVTVTTLVPDVTYLHGFLQAQLDSDATPGATNDLTFTVDGRTVTVPVQVSTGKCDTTCQTGPVTTMSKSGLWSADNTANMDIENVTVSADGTYSGSDTLTNPGQFFECAAIGSNVFAYLATGKDATGAPAGMSDTRADVTSCTTDRITYSLYQPAGTFSHVLIPVKTDTSSNGPWTDTATFTAPDGSSWSADASVSKFSGGGDGDVTTPAPTPTTTTPAPTPTLPAPKPPVKVVPKTYTRLVQVDAVTYTSPWFMNTRYNALAADGLLKPGEGRPLWPVLGKGVLAKEVATIRPVSVTSTTVPTKAQWLAAAAVTTGKPLSAAKPATIAASVRRGSETVVWLLDPAASAAAPFGPRYDKTQVYLGYAAR